MGPEALLLHLRWGGKVLWWPCLLSLCVVDGKAWPLGLARPWLKQQAVSPQPCDGGLFMIRVLVRFTPFNIVVIYNASKLQSLRPMTALFLAFLPVRSCLGGGIPGCLAAQWKNDEKLMYSLQSYLCKLYIIFIILSLLWSEMICTQIYHFLNHTLAMLLP